MLYYDLCDPQRSLRWFFRFSYYKFTIVALLHYKFMTFEFFE